MGDVCVKFGKKEITQESGKALMVNSLHGGRRSEFFPPISQDNAGQKCRRNCIQLHMQEKLLDCPQSFYLCGLQSDLASENGGVTDGTRTRNSQNHNLELYH